jgi:deoxyribonuclease-1
MKGFAALVLILMTTVALAQQDQKLPDGKWAFYGEEFYTTLASTKKFERALFNKIMNQTHMPTKGKLDVIGAACLRSGPTLRSGACYKHVSVGYTAARKIMFGELDVLKDTKGTYVVDVYCGKKFYFTTIDSVSGMHAQVNIEHTWPQSKFTSAFPRDQQKSDMHHLYLADSQANSVRGNNPFGLVDASADRMGGEGCKASRFGLIHGSEVYTPPVSHRGNVARALFYFSMHYNLPIDSTQEKILRDWHKNDAVDESEIKRHEGIAKYEKMRNPFVDYPELVNRVSDF